MRSIGDRSAVCFLALMFAVQLEAQSIGEERKGGAETYGTAAATFLTLQACRSSVPTRR